MGISRTQSVMLLVIAAALDVCTTNVGVVIQGNPEFSPVARLVIQTLGTDWWIVYLPYEATVFVCTFLGVRYLRTRLSRLIGHWSLKVPVEYLLMIISYAPVVNNTFHLLSGSIAVSVIAQAAKAREGLS